MELRNEKTIARRKINQLHKIDTLTGPIVDSIESDLYIYLKTNQRDRLHVKVKPTSSWLQLTQYEYSVFTQRV